MAATLENVLYLCVLPMISLGTGKAEQFLTLYPDKNFATSFFPDEVVIFESMFKNRVEYFTGGHVKNYSLDREYADDGRIIVVVTQHVG